MISVTAARPYAKAAFSAAKSANQLPLWSHALKQLALAVSDKKMYSTLKNPTISPSELSKLFISFLHDVSNNPSEKELLPIENFIKLTADKKRLALLPSISDLFETDVAREAGYISLTVTSAFPMDDTQKKNTIEKLSEQLNSKCEIEFKIDEKLIGGVLVRSGSWVMDGTVKGALERLRTALA
jgi:F-type H+-transporting ATPase subunit delta